MSPAFATLRAKVPAGDKWVHEIKWDGYRVQIRAAMQKMMQDMMPVAVDPASTKEFKEAHMAMMKNMH